MFPRGFSQNCLHREPKLSVSFCLSNIISNWIVRFYSKNSKNIQHISISELDNSKGPWNNLDPDNNTHTND